LAGAVLVGKVVLIALIALFVRLPLLDTVYWRTPDAVEYVDVARNIASGAGFTQKIKYAFFDSSPVVTSALRGRPLATSVIFALILRLTDNVYWLQAFVILVNVANIVLLYWLARKFLSGWWPFLVAFFAALNPNALISSRLLLSETIFTFFALLALGVFFRAKESRLKPITVGALCALAFLTRFEGILLLGVLLLFSRQKLMVLAFVLLTLPYFVANNAVNGNPFYSYNVWHFQVRQFQEGMAGGFGRIFPTPWEFVRSNSAFILSQISRNFVNHLGSLLDWRSLGLFSVPLFLAARKYGKEFRLIFLFVTAVILIYSLLWSAIFETARHFILIYYLLLIPVFYYLSLRRPRWTNAILAVTLFLYIISDAKRLVWARNVDPMLDNWSPRTNPQLFTWLRQNTRPTDILTGVDPFLLNHFTLRPAIITPSNLFADNYKRFVNQYGVDYFLVDNPSQFAAFDQVAKLQTELQGVRVYSSL
jgi:4-amino-4-deoxy-L-arabinose transferase-like glycosyltransferase